MMLYAYSMNFETFAKALASNFRTEGIPMNEVVALWKVLEPTYAPPRFPLRGDDIDRLVEIAVNTPGIMANIDVNPYARRKIEAIKDLRNVANCGLAQAKDAIDHICYNLDIETIRRKLRA